jgi:ketosteroid isomerase-like protein
MRKQLFVHALLPLAMPIVMWAQSAPLSAAGVRAARAASNAAIAARDTIALASLVTPSYHSVSSRNAHSNGRAGEGERWRQQFSAHPDVSYVRTPVTIRLFVPWQMAEETGAWVGRWSEADGRVEIRGGYVAKWRRIDGRWLLEAEVFTPTSCRGSAYCTASPPQPPTP